MTTSHEREENSRHPAVRSVRKLRFRHGAGAPRVRMNDRQIALITNVNPSTAIAPAGPSTATEMPPTAPPIAIPSAGVVESSPYASCRFSADTVCGTMPLNAGRKNASAAP